MKRFSRGFTLMELIVASALSILLLTVLYQFAGSAYRVAHEEFERNGVESKIMILSKQLIRDLETSSSSGLSLTAASDTVAIHPVILTATGQLTYENRFLAWQFDSTQKIVGRYESKSVPGVTFTGQAIRLGPPILSTISSSGDFDRIKQFSKIEHFELQNPAGVVAPHVGSPLTLRISAILDRAKTRKQLDFERIIQLRTPTI